MNHYITLWFSLCLSQCAPVHLCMTDNWCVSLAGWLGICLSICLCACESHCTLAPTHPHTNCGTHTYSHLPSLRFPLTKLNIDVNSLSLQGSESGTAETCSRARAASN